MGSSGRLTVSRAGEGVRKLVPGKYRLAVVDRSPTGGVARSAKQVVTLTGGTFVGSHTAPVSPTSGKWLFVTESGGMPVFAVTVG